VIDQGRHTVNATGTTTGSGEKPLRIMAVGDCNTGGANGTAPETQMVRQVAMLLESAGFTCRVRNLGHTMSTSREGVARMERDGEPADLLLLNFGLVDAWVTSIPQVYLSYYPDHVVKKWARKLLKSLKRRLRADWLRRWVPVGEVVPIEEYEQNICRILDLSRESNPDVCCILWGTVAVPGDEARSRNIERYNGCLRSIADGRARTRYLDATALIRDLTRSEAYLDHVHISKRAAQQIATGVAQVCLEDLLKPDGSRRRGAA
jgi:lysophospholipase L1-like esterase